MHRLRSLGLSLSLSWAFAFASGGAAAAQTTPAPAVSAPPTSAPANPLTAPQTTVDQPATIAVPLLDDPPAINGVIDASWAKATQVALQHDFTNRRAADEPTTAVIAQDATSIDVAFDVTQHEEFVESNETNGSSVISDDYVGVYFSPNGPLGFQYAFFANPRGARYQTSSENSAYTPAWNAYAKRTPSGYTITLRIPLNVIRSAGRTSWRVQFVRATVRANALDVWSFNEHASSVSDATYFGTATGIGVKAATVSRPRPRAQLYGLGELTNPANGGDTSRVGADLAIPVAPTASIVASLHPDYSNVETDQQTISPTAFAHQYTEVRPFFTQAAASFNYNFVNINGPLLFYTPSIPTFRDGYALEGTQGPLTYAALDAVGVDRTDEAQTLDYNVSNTARSFGVNVQNIDVNGDVDGLLGLHDDVTSVTTGYGNQHSHEIGFLNYAQEDGTTVTDPSQAKYLQTGYGYATATTTAFVFYEGMGSQFDPVDAYVAQNDIHGPALLISQTWPFKANTILHDIQFSSYDSNFRNHLEAPSQNNASGQVNVDFSNLLTVHAYYNEEAVRTYANELLPFDANGFLVGYKFATSTPTYVEYEGGPYYHGHLDAWTYLTTLRLAPRVHLTLETDEDQYLTVYPGELRTNQWLERASLDFQISKEMQFDFGARRVIGAFLPTYALAPVFTPVTGGNISAAFHFLSRDGKSEFYAVYGDADSFSTTPAVFLKYIRYVGAPKGT
jgi:hypothetical protein